MSMTQQQVQNLTNLDNLVERFTDCENGVAVFVTTGRYGFHVSIKDTDADQFLDTVNTFSTQEKATAYARLCVA